MKKTLKSILAGAAIIALGCSAFARDKNEITVISRESGSGTRSAFIEIFGVEQKNAAGKKIDMTTPDADITNSTQVAITSVSKNKNAIGYISLGSLNSSVKALKIDGAAASIENIKNGTYKVSRPFNIVTKSSGASGAAQDFIDFVLSNEGSAIITKAGYIANGNGKAYKSNGAKGKVTVAGSSSVYPVMEKLAEGYRKANPDANIEVSQSDSTIGVKSAIDGICDIGMASRDLKSSEAEKGVAQTTIATDGIAVIVNKANRVDGLSKETVRDIYTGKITSWTKVQ